MATWGGVTKLLRVPLEELGGGPRGILIEIRKGVWFQVCDIGGTATLGWTMDDSDGKNLGHYESDVLMKEQSDESVAALIKSWADEQGVTL